MHLGTGDTREMLARQRSANANRLLLGTHDHMTLHQSLEEVGRYADGYKCYRVRLQTPFSVNGRRT